MEAAMSPKRSKSTASKWPDIHINKEFERAIKHTQLLKEYKKAVDYSTIVSISDKKGYITYINDAFVKVSGYSREELIGKPHNIIRHPDSPSEVFKVLWETILNKKPWHGIIKNRSKDGSTYYVDSSITPILDNNGDIKQFIAIRHDITKVFEQEQLINRQLTDHLTGLPNRLKLMQDLKEESYSSLAIFNLDGFQELNKLYGYKVGDEILIRIADYFSETFNKEQRLYKLPSDEFAVLCAMSCNEDTCQDILTSLINQLSTTLFKIDEHEIYLNVTAGVSYGSGMEALINADIALNNAKKRKLSFMFYDKSKHDDDEYAANQKIIKDLRYAIKHNLIIPYFQPIFNNKTLQIEKYETLMRIINEEGEVIPPNLFLEIAQKVKIYPELMKLILQKAFVMFHDKDIQFSINLSIEDIRNKTRQTYVLDMLSHFERPQNVIFEIVESEEIQDYSKLKEFVKEIKKYGAQIAIDDFGSGYSNFMHLLELEVDFIKIDGSIIENILEDRNSQILTKTIVSMAKQLDLKVIAEYVSSKEIHDAIKLLGIDYSQGYYHEEPQPYLRED
jgi:PAS domain S-box-containing protein/diguanylate cyclase (GGDEF)-like protein